MYRLAGYDEIDPVPRLSVWFLLIFPTSYFLHINFTESLFLALTLATFVSARERNWRMAGLFGIFACMARLNGLILVPALLVEAYLEYRETRRWRWEWLLISLVPLGFGIHLLINKIVAGDAFALFAIGKETYYRSAAPPWNGIKGLYDAMWGTDPAQAMMGGIQELFFVALGLAGVVACWRYLRGSFTVWMVGNWIVFTSTNFLQSVPRYVLTMFPLFILFARLARNPTWYSGLTVAMILFLALFIGQLVRGHWAF